MAASQVPAQVRALGCAVVLQPGGRHVRGLRAVPCAAGNAHGSVLQPVLLPGAPPRLPLVCTAPGLAHAGGEDHELVVYRAPSLEGPWTPYGPGSFAAKAATGSPGAAFVWQGVLHRLGRSCRRGACGEVQLVQVSMGRGGEASPVSMHIGGCTGEPGRPATHLVLAAGTCSARAAAAVCLRVGACGFGPALCPIQVGLTDGKLQQSSQPLGLNQSPWLQRARWDSAGWAALSLAQRADGTFLAAVEGRQLPHVPPPLPRLLSTAVAGFRALALLCIVALLLSAAGQLPTLRGLLLQRRWGSLLLAWTAGQPAACSRAACKAEDMPGARWPCGQPGNKAHLGAPPCQLRGTAVMEAGMLHEGGDASGNSQATSLCSSASSAYRRIAASGATSSSSAALPPDAFGSGGSSAAGRRQAPQPLLARLRALRWRMLLTAVTLVLALLGLWAARVATRIAAPFADPPVAVPVGGQYSRFTLMVMSYDRRLKELQWYVRHYSQCPSVSELLTGCWKVFFCFLFFFGGGDALICALLSSASPVQASMQGSWAGTLLVHITVCGGAHKRGRNRALPQ